MIVDIRPVSKQARCNEADAVNIIFRLGAVLAGKFPGIAAGEWSPTAEEVQSYVGWRDAKNVVAQLRHGIVPIRLYKVVSPELVEALIAEEANGAGAPQRIPVESPAHPAPVDAADAATPAEDGQEQSSSSTAERQQIEKQKRRMQPLGYSDGFRWCATPGCSGTVRNGETCSICERTREDNPPPPRRQQAAEDTHEH